MGGAPFKEKAGGLRARLPAKSRGIFGFGRGRILRRGILGPTHIGVGLGGHIPLPQPAVHQEFQQFLYAGEHRLADVDTQLAGIDAAHQDGHDDPVAGDARGVAQNFGPQDVAVKLLEGHDEDHEHQTLLGTDQQDQECRRHRAQEGPEEGDHDGHAHHPADQRGVGQFQEGAADNAQYGIRECVSCRKNLPLE